MNSCIEACSGIALQHEPPHEAHLDHLHQEQVQLSAPVWLPFYAALTGFRPLLVAPVGGLIGQSLYLGVLAGGVAVMLYAHGVRVIGSSLSAQFTVLIPAFGALLAVSLLGEHLAVAQWAGIAAVVLGIFAAAFSPRPALATTGTATDAR